MNADEAQMNADKATERFVPKLASNSDRDFLDHLRQSALHLRSSAFSKPFA